MTNRSPIFSQCFIAMNSVRDPMRVISAVTEWVFPAATISGHIEPSSVKKQQAKAFALSRVSPFELYSLRHTCLTRWAPHMDPWTLGYLAGHTEMSITKRYVHPQQGTVRDAMISASGHNSGHTSETVKNGKKLEIAAIN